MFCLLTPSPSHQPAQIQLASPPKPQLSPTLLLGGCKHHTQTWEKPSPNPAAAEEPPLQRPQHAYLPNLSLLLKSAPLLNSKLRHSTFLQELGRRVRHRREGSAAATLTPPSCRQGSCTPTHTAWLCGAQRSPSAAATAGSARAKPSSSIAPVPPALPAPPCTARPNGTRRSHGQLSPAALLASHCEPFPTSANRALQLHVK